MQMMAIYRPRLYIVEAGNSMGLLAEDLKRHGLNVYSVSLSPGAEVSLPPFADALRLLEDPTEVEPDDEDDLEGDDELDSGRDILGEMEIAARIMITGGEDKEEARVTRSDRRVIREAIYNAALQVRRRGGDMVLPEHVSDAMLEASENQGLTDTRRDRIREMADSIALFTDRQSLAGHLFNRQGKNWPAADVTLVDLGTLAKEGYEGELAVAYVSLMNHINNVVERYQYAARETLVVTDEAHIITTNPLLARYVVKITKMWRKLGAWYWAATQNLEDFPDASKRMLNMMEWWLCLVMPKEEVDQIARFKELNEENKRMLLDARKEPGKFVEGVVLSDTVQTIFRTVPPALALALSMTEKHEKAQRAQLMEELGLESELDASYEVAKRIELKR
jgi:conjugative transfer ATPase